MIRAKSNRQEVLFETPFSTKLDPENRWVKMSNSIPWEELNREYYKMMHSTMGSPGKDGRMIIGAVLIKHLCGYSDEETIEQIRENVYMQYLVGLPSFTTKPIFDPSLFVTIRKRLGEDAWKKLNDLFVAHAQSEAQAHDDLNQTGGEPSPPDSQSDQTKAVEEETNKGELLLDATAAPQDIHYPTDLDLLNESREKLEKIIEIACNATGAALPRRYRLSARRDYLSIAKKKHRTKKEIRKAIGKQLRYVRRNLKHVDTVLNQHQNLHGILTRHELKYLQVTRTLYEQQKEMFDTRTHTVSDRIVSIHQPHVRPIVRGKARADVEFGAKIGVSVQDGFARIETLDWNNYDEAKDLVKAAESYKERYGYYPAKIIGDRKYITREHRRWCSEHGIVLSGKPLGRPSAQTKEQLKMLKKDSAKRNAIEGKFGQGKRAYGLDRIYARLKETSESWIGAIFFALNVVRTPDILLRLIALAGWLGMNIGIMLTKIFIQRKSRLLFQ